MNTSPPLLQWIDIANPPASNGVKFDIVKFPGGEVHPRIEPAAGLLAMIGSHNIKSSTAMVFRELLVIARLRTSDDVMALALLLGPSGALATAGYAALAVIIPYVPYARQDRITAPGEPIATNVIANLLHNMPLVSMTIIDPHSNAIVNALSAKARVDVLSTHTAAIRFIAKMMKGQCALPTSTIVLIAPDEGSIKRTEELAKTIQTYSDVRTEVDPTEFNYNVEVWYASKKRDVKTGQITGVNLTYTDPVEGAEAKYLFVFDDICDGGRTFTELAKKLVDSPYVTESRFLFVTHGIFSKGIEPLLDAYTEIGTIDSFRSADEYSDLYPNNDRFHVIPLIEDTYNRKSTQD